MTVQDFSEAGLGRGAAEVPGQALAVGVVVVGEAELASFYETRVEALLNYLVRKAGRDDAEDLLSQVFEQFFIWWPQHPCHPSPVGTLYRIAQCRLADRLRRDGRTLTVEASDLEEALGEGDHADGFTGVDLRVDLGRALAELSERERQALLLRYVADLPVGDCAEVLELAVDNMKKILKTALRTLRQSPRMDTYEPAGWAKEVHR
ncbi:RNA polymerase sigma factor [Streptomyces sp. NPDC058256]|uniref:RNA polymerase sigma factor n=1 Tax=Streptomyces sp. NPDC058256 TaxID=3346408 RepID=UPI0036EF2D90